jgi:hypothetical protein
MPTSPNSALNGRLSTFHQVSCFWFSLSFAHTLTHSLSLSFLLVTVVILCLTTRNAGAEWATQLSKVFNPEMVSVFNMAGIEQTKPRRLALVEFMKETKNGRRFASIVVSNTNIFAKEYKDAKVADALGRIDLLVLDEATQVRPESALTTLFKKLRDNMGLPIIAMTGDKKTNWLSNMCPKLDVNIDNVLQICCDDLDVQEMRQEVEVPQIKVDEKICNLGDLYTVEELIRMTMSLREHLDTIDTKDITTTAKRNQKTGEIIAFLYSVFMGHVACSITLSELLRALLVCVFFFFFLFSFSSLTILFFCLSAVDQCRQPGKPSVQRQQ